jgi:thymidylate kinase
MVIVLEGMDAAGKKTQSELLAARLDGTRFAFPNYESPTGKLILGHLKKEWTCARHFPNVATWAACADDTDARVFQSLQTVNRIELLPQIHEAKRKGHVVFDRYWQSAVVYGALDGLDMQWLRLVQEKPMPPADINILIDVPVDEGFKRRPERRDRYETNRPFLEKVRSQYITLWTMSASMGLPGEWFIVGGLGSVEEVHDRIIEIVRRTLPMKKVVR